jgi:hypothetical protein
LHCNWRAFSIADRLYFAKQWGELWELWAEFGDGVKGEAAYRGGA